MLEKFNDQKLSDEALDDVTGGGFIKDLFDAMKNKKQSNNSAAVGQKNQGEYKCLSCPGTSFFSWKLDTYPVCPKCGEMINLKRVSDLLN